jgi:hypothetical protein
MGLAWKAAASAHPGLAAVLLGIANTSAGWIAHDYIHGKRSEISVYAKEYGTRGRCSIYVFVMNISVDRSSVCFLSS